MSTPDLPDDDRRIGWGLRWSAGVMVAIALVVWATRAFWPPPPPESSFGSLPLPTYPATTVPGPVTDLPALPLVDVTSESGLQFIHDRGATTARRIPETMGGGSVAWDYDLDGDLDLLLIHSAIWSDGGSSLVLYANQGTGTFRDVTTASGLQASLVGMGGAAADYDEDGWPDLLVTGVEGSSLWHNEGGWFRDVTLEVFGDDRDRGWSLAAAWLDYDWDGDLDLFLSHYLDWSAERDDRLDCRWNGVDPSYCDPDLFEGLPPRLYRNEGDSRFLDVTEAAGLEVRNPDTGQSVPKVTAAVATDLDGDGWLDVVATGDGAPNLVYLNQQTGGFREVGREWGLAYDRQGLAVRSLGLDVAWRDGGASPVIAMGRVGNMMNACFVRAPDAKIWIDEALLSGWGLPSRLVCTWGSRFVDMDLDGRLDLVSANGQLQEDLETLQLSQSRAQPPQLFWSRSAIPPKYERMTAKETGDAALRPLCGRGVNAGDFDGDGDADLLFTTNGGPPRLLRNDQTRGHHFLHLELKGRVGPRDPRGARVTLPDVTGSQAAEWQPMGGYLTQHESAIRIGLGGVSQVDRVVITWPDGQRQELPAPPVDRRLIVVQPQAGESPIAAIFPRRPGGENE
jgi:hypothetical protein